MLECQVENYEFGYGMNGCAGGSGGVFPVLGQSWD